MNRRSICFVLLSAILVFSNLTVSNAQIRREELNQLTGAQKMSPEEYLKIQQVKMMRSFTTLSGKSSMNLPKAVDLSGEFPPIQRQTDQSCMGWTFAYTLKSYHERLENGWEYGPNHLFSPTFLFNQLYERDEQGNYIKGIEAMKFMVEYGAAPLSLCPYTPDDFTLPSEQLKRFALAFRALTYRRLPQRDLVALKSMLASGEPVAVSMPIYQEFLDLSRKNPIMRKRTSTEILSVHYLVAVGYDDVKHAIKLYNSWGTEWADKGYGWIDYDLWNSEFGDDALVLYDRPTPPEAVVYLQNPKVKPAGPLPDFKMMEADLPTAAISREDPTTLIAIGQTVASYTSSQAASLTTSEIAAASPDLKVLPKKTPVVIVPEEAGIVIADHWLHLGAPLRDAQKFVIAKNETENEPLLAMPNGIQVDRGFMSPDEIGRIDFFPNSHYRVETNRGVGIASARSKVRKIYRTPDDTSADKTRDTYFFAAATKDWGGVKFVSNAALEFIYDEKGMVYRISLFTVYVPAYTGKALQPIEENEYQQKAGAQIVNSREGHMSFAVPEHFAKVDKAVWAGIGVGYFIKEHPLNGTWMVTVKVFEVAGATRETLLNDRIPADKKVYQMLNLKPPVPVTFKGREWFLVEDASGAFVNYYTVENGRYYQVNVATDVPVTREKWLLSFFNSITIKE